jgi:hypothetical protein
LAWCFIAAAVPDSLITHEQLNPASLRRMPGSLFEPLPNMRWNFLLALELFQSARRSVPEYTSLHMEYTCLVTECQAKLQGALTAADRETVADEMEQGQVLWHTHIHGYCFILKQVHIKANTKCIVKVHVKM